MSRKRLILVDDDRDLISALLERFRLLDEFETDTASTAEEALGAMQARRYDVVVLDVGLPDMDGRELCRLLRRQGLEGIVIMLTGINSESDTIYGLECGADDYIAKPVKFEELLARIRAHLRQIARMEHTEDSILVIGPIVFDASTRQLKGERGNTVELSDREAEILKYLFFAPGVVERSRLLTEVWGYARDTDTHTVESHIYRLRKKLLEAAPEQDFLITEKNGYRLVR